MCTHLVSASSISSIHLSVCFGKNPLKNYFLKILLAIAWLSTTSTSPASSSTERLCWDLLGQSLKCRMIKQVGADSSFLILENWKMITLSHVPLVDVRRKGFQVILGQPSFEILKIESYLFWGGRECFFSHSGKIAFLQMEIEKAFASSSVLTSSFLLTKVWWNWSSRPKFNVEPLIRMNRFQPEFSHKAFFSPAVCSWDRPKGASGPTEEASPEETGSRHGGCHRHGHGGAVQRRRPGLQLSNRWSRRPRKQTDGWIELTQPLGESHSSLIQKWKEVGKKESECYIWMLCTSVVNQTRTFWEQVVRDVTSTFRLYSNCLSSLLDSFSLCCQRHC